MTTMASGVRDTRGVHLLLMLVMLAWGSNIPAIKALAGVLDVIWVGALRLGAACIAITVYLWWRDRRLPRLTAREWRTVAAIALLTIYANQLLFVHGMRLASATNASLVMALMPLLALPAGALVLRERIAARAIVGVVLGFAGVAVVVLHTARNGVHLPGLGELLILAGVAAFIGGGLLIQRTVRERDVLVVGWAVYLCGALALWVHACMQGGWQGAVQALREPWVAWVALLSGVIGTALSNVGWYHALGRLGQSRASPYLYWVTIFGVAASALALSEPLSAWHGLGLALVVAGVRLGAGGAPAGVR